MIFKKRKKELDVAIKQEGRIIVFLRKLLQQDSVNLFFSIAFQLLPIWVMILIRIVSDYSFNIREFTSNLMIFVIVACATNLSELLRINDEFKNKLSTICMIFCSTLILCISSILYCLLIVQGFAELRIKDDILLAISVVFTLFVVLIGYWMISRKEK